MKPRKPSDESQADAAAADYRVKCCAWISLANGDCGSKRVVARIFSPPQFKMPPRYFCRQHAYNMRQMGFCVGKLEST